MKRLAIIPARGGSKRIPRKNIKLFRGLPIITYSIRAALKSNLFDEVMVSTDDEEIATLAKQHGASTPFKRSLETSNDAARIIDVIKEVLNSYKTTGKITFDSVCCILPTAPLIQIHDLKRALELLEKKRFDSVFPVAKFSYPIFRALEKHDDKINMFWPENYNKRSQDLPPAFHDAGQFYWINPEKCFNEDSLFTTNSGAIELSELYVQDIDTEDDWKLCELKQSLIHD